MNSFVHLHLHSEYSLLDGCCRVKEIPARIRECGQEAVAITDHGVMYGVVEFWQACKEAGIKPIIGCEVYVAHGSRFDKTHSGEGYADHLVLLCENQKGYENLSKMVSLSFTEGFYNRPRVDDELLRTYSEGLIALSACLGGKIPRLLAKGDFTAAEQTAVHYRELFGENNFFIELQDHGLQEDREMLPKLVSLAEKLDLPLVATNDCHYLRRQDAEKQAVLMCIQTNTTVDAGRPEAFATDEFYCKDNNEMEMLFRAYPQALSNTVRIADRCHVEFDFSTTYLPKFPCPKGKNASVYLKELTEIGFSKRVAEKSIDFATREEKIYRERMEYELSVITGMGYDDYFLIVQDYVNFARSADIPVGPGRGSGAGSLVAFCLGITDVDPLKYDLLFERFLNPERVSMPDIDMDFCYNRRDEVIDYVCRRYGKDHVSQIITFGTLAARAAIRDVGRALGMSYADVDAVARAVPQELNITISMALKMPDLKRLYEGSEQVKRLVDTAMALEGMPRNVSIHAAGVVITDRPVSDYVPLSVSNGTVVTQFDMDTVAHLGLLKFDFLALRYLTIIHDAELMIRERIPEFSIESIPMDDADSYKLISLGKTGGVFQLESAGIRKMLMNLEPQSIEDIIAAIALYRPGPMDSIPKFTECRHHPEKVTYATPLLEPILASTYGCVVYQEQVMQVFRELGGYTFGHADVVRRAMAKKKASVLLAEKDTFIAGAVDRGVEKEVAEKLFADMESFANYAFNKSHAAAYAVISYRTAYLKQHYPQEYFAALLTSVLGNQTKVAEYISECSSIGIRVLPPDVNESKPLFSVNGKDIRFGLLAIKNVGKTFLDAILAERRHGVFRSFEDFIDRMPSGDLNKRMVESLLKAGCFDRLGRKRSQLLATYEIIIEKAAEKGRNNVDGQLDMFSMMDSAVQETVSVEYPDIPEFSVHDRLMQEREATGMFFSGNLLDGYSEFLSLLMPKHISEIVGEEADVADKQKVILAGIVSSVTFKNTRNGGRMAFFTLEDSYGEVECVIFAGKLDAYRGFLQADSAVAVTGTVSVREDRSPSVLLQNIIFLPENGTPESRKVPAGFAAESAKESNRNEEGKTNTSSESNSSVQSKPISAVPNEKPKKLFLRVPDFSCELYCKARNIAEIFEGNFPVAFYDASTKQYDFSHPGIDFSPYVLHQFQILLGEENVIPR